MKKPRAKPTPSPTYDYQFVKSFIFKGLDLAGVNYQVNEIEGEAGQMMYIQTDTSLYGFWTTVDGRFEAWARNQGGFEAAKKEGFTDTDLLKKNISMGLPIWLELARPEDIVAFLAGRDFTLIAPDKKTLNWLQSGAGLN